MYKRQTQEHPAAIERVDAAVRASVLAGPSRVALYAMGPELEVHVHVAAPSGMRLSEVHAHAEALERRILALLPYATRALVHAEPRDGDGPH